MLNRLFSRYWLLVPMLVLIVVLLDRVEEPDVVETEQTINMRETRSDYYMSEFRTQKFDDNGLLEYIIEGATLAHYPDDDRSEIIDPSIELRREEAVWLIKSKRGRFMTAESLFTLDGNVTVLRNSSRANVEPVTIETESITVATESNQVYTDAPISIIAPQWQLSATGLRSAIDEGKLSLLSSVEGRYELPDSAVED